MKLVYLHGPPASGKYTIARELETLVGARNLHNHLTLDVARALFPFGTPEFWELVEGLRALCLEAASRLPDAIVAYTTCYSDPHDAESLRAMERIVEDAGGQLMPVFLQCDTSELERRVADPSRAGMRKLRTVEGLREFLADWNITAVPRRSFITVATGHRTPRSCAEEIVERLGLQGNPGSAS